MEQQTIGFDEARDRTEAMFGGEELSAEPAQTDQTEAVPEGSEETVPEEAPAQEDTSVPEETAPQDTAPQWQDALREVTDVAQKNQTQLTQAMSEIAQLREQNTKLQELVGQLSQRREEEVVEEALAPPAFDVGALMFEDEETQKAAANEYAQRMQAYSEQLAERKIKEQLAPYIAEAERVKDQKVQDELFSVYGTMPEFKGIDSLRPQIMRIMEQNDYMHTLPPDKRIVHAYLMAKGAQAVGQEAKAPTVDELMGFYNGNRDFRDAIEKKRIAELKGAQDVPPFSPSTGAVNAALNIPKEPQSFDEAAERTRKLFGKN